MLEFMAGIHRMGVSLLLVLAGMPLLVAQIGATAQLSGTLTVPAGRAISSDLYAMQFRPAGGPADIAGLETPASTASIEFNPLAQAT